MASEFALKIVQIVDDEGYYDRPAASEAVDLYALADVRVTLEGLQLRRLSDGSPCWCLSPPSVVRAAKTGAYHADECERTRSLMNLLTIRRDDTADTERER